MFDMKLCCSDTNHVAGELVLLPHWGCQWLQYLTISTSITQTLGQVPVVMVYILEITLGCMLWLVASTSHSHKWNIIILLSLYIQVWHILHTIHVYHTRYRFILALEQLYGYISWYYMGAVSLWYCLHSYGDTGVGPFQILVFKTSPSFLIFCGVSSQIPDFWDTLFLILLRLCTLIPVFRSPPWFQILPPSPSFWLTFPAVIHISPDTAVLESSVYSIDCYLVIVLRQG